jgi:hypothetical protein
MNPYVVEESQARYQERIDAAGHVASRSLWCWLACRKVPGRVEMR